MRYKRLLIFLILILLIFNVSALGYEHLNLNNIYNAISELSSDKYRGRLAGDIGNTMAEKYIENEFEKLSLKPAGDKGSYLQSFEIITPQVIGSCYLKVYDSKNKLVKEYKYGTDFKEIPYGASAPGIVRSTAKSQIASKGSILLVESGRIGEEPVDYELDLALKKKGIKAVIYPSNMNLRFRSPYKLQKEYSEGLVKLMVSKNVFKELSSFSEKGYEFEVKSSLEIKKVTVNNVISVLKGKNPSLPPIILSAHFDHVGYDADGVVYPGAFDNASGAALLLECARVLKSYPQFERTIVFAAFNGEEEGLLGSQYFVEHPPLDIKDSDCINFDMVGSVKDIPLSILSFGPNKDFTNEISACANSCKVKTNTLDENNSDHGPFCVQGLNAVTLLHNDTTKIHTPEDTLDNINTAKLKEVFTTLESYLKSKDIAVAFSTGYSPQRDKKTFVIVSSIFILLFALTYYSKHLNKKQSR